MTAPIIRDIDIVSQAGNFTELQEITATADGKEITLLKSDTTPGADFATAIANAGANSTVVLNGTYTGINSLTNVQEGQTIIGGGAMDIQTPDGRSVTVLIPNASISGTGSNGGGGSSRLFEMSDNSSLIGITATIEQTSSATIARIDGKQNVTIRDNTLTVTSDATANGIQIDTSQNVTIDNNTVSIVANGSGGQFLAFQGTSSNVSVNNNTVSMTGTTAPANQYYVFFSGGVTVNNLSGTGNTSNFTSCYFVSAGTTTVTGSITTSGTTCP